MKNIMMMEILKRKKFMNRTGEMQWDIYKEIKKLKKYKMKNIKNKKRKKNKKKKNKKKKKIQY